MRNKLLLAALMLAFSSQLVAQKKWNLLECVQYAMENNLTVKQVALQENFSELTLKQSKLSQYPNLSFGGNLSFNSGRNQDPTTFSLITQSYLSSGYQLQSSAEIFNWFSKKNTIAANNWELMAAKANTEKLKNDIALAVANFYLQVLLAREQSKIAGVQLEQSKAQLVNTRKLVDAGALPELNAAELEAQVARDSANVIAAKGNITSALLSLKAYMSIEADQAFDIDAPPVESIFVFPISELQPDVVYTSAIANLPQQRYNDFKMKAAVKTSAVSKAGMYPTLSAFGSLGTNYASFFNIPNYKQVPNGTNVSTGLKADAGGGVFYDVVTPGFNQVRNGNRKSNAFFTQMSDNFRQSVGISISVPIFNGSSLRSNYERSKISIKNLEIQKQIDNQKLKQDIYTAYNSAVVALEKFNAGKKSVETAERSYSFAKKRYDIGMSSTIELITNQNNLFTQKLQNALNQFDYVFKMKVLEFYKGQGLKF